MKNQTFVFEVIKDPVSAYVMPRFYVVRDLQGRVILASDDEAELVKFLANVEFKG